MNLHDIQSSLDELEKRHPGLTEEMVGVLLAAGGWEKKSIEEAQLLFRSRAEEHILPHEDQAFLPPLEEKLIEAPHTVARETAKEPESLVVTPETHDTTPHALPDNLPLRPFETSPHVWSFSKYKDVFHADVQDAHNNVHKAPVEEVHVPQPVVHKEPVTPQPLVQSPDIEQPVTIPQTPRVVVEPPSEILVVKSPLTKKDEVMIAFGAALLLAAVLLILYMFNNGRL